MVSANDINFRILAYEVDAGVYVCDPEGNFIYANLALADIFDVEHPRDIIGNNFKNFISPEKANDFMIQLRKSMTSKSRAMTIFTEIIRQDAKTAYLEVHAMPFIKEKVLVGNQGVVHDIKAMTFSPRSEKMILRYYCRK